MYKIITLLAILIFSIYAQQDTTTLLQDTTAILSQDSIIPQDTIIIQQDTPEQQLVKLYPDSVLLLNLRTQYYATEKFHQIDSIKKLANHYKKKTNKDSLERAKTLNRLADSISSTLFKDYPTAEKYKPTLYKESSSKGTGVILILAGITSTILTIVEANKVERISTEVPVYNSRGTKTGTTNKITEVPHEWTMHHTIYSILSGGLIISGIITLSF